MRALLFLALMVAIPACKKQVEGTVARCPDSILRPSDVPFKTFEATLLYTILRAPAANSIFAFYRADMERREAHRNGDTFVDDNLDHGGDFGIGGSPA